MSTKQPNIHELIAYFDRYQRYELIYAKKNSKVKKYLEKWDVQEDVTKYIEQYLNELDLYNTP